VEELVCPDELALELLLVEELVCPDEVLLELLLVEELVCPDELLLDELAMPFTVSEVIVGRPLPLPQNPKETAPPLAPITVL
jgi:hypothetical protein